MLASLLAGFPHLTKPETGQPLATEAEVNKALIRRAAFILPQPWEGTMFERGLNLRKLIPTALKTSGGRSLIYLVLAVLALSYGLSRLTPSTPVSETPLASGTASMITTSLSSGRGEPVRLAVPESLFRLGRVFVIAGKSPDDALAFRTAARNHDQLGTVEPTYVPPPHKTMHEYILAGQLRLSRQIEVRARLGVLASRDIYFVSYLEVCKAR